ncbi:DUF732 domain-containing protein [Mycolicibacterium phlei]|uniref:DUF732 domain-containing protein n=1 Tax=Mycolicibacterium phlei TaxID=1771 RepID=UPI00178C673F|nr:DUF732 domain-containing protein [Mycolicibacterium phlei]
MNKLAVVIVALVALATSACGSKYSSQEQSFLKALRKDMQPGWPALSDGEALAQARRACERLKSIDRSRPVNNGDFFDAAWMLAGPSSQYGNQINEEWQKRADRSMKVVVNAATQYQRQIAHRRSCNPPTPRAAILRPHPQLASTQGWSSNGSAPAERLHRECDGMKLLMS